MTTQTAAAGSQLVFTRIRSMLSESGPINSTRLQVAISDIDSEIASMADRNAALKREWAAAILDATAESLAAHESQMRASEFDRERLTAARGELERRLTATIASEAAADVSAMIARAIEIGVGSKKRLDAIDVAAEKLARQLAESEADIVEYGRLRDRIEKIAPQRAGEIDFASRNHRRFGMRFGFGGAEYYKLTRLADDIQIWPTYSPV